MPALRVLISDTNHPFRWCFLRHVHTKDKYVLLYDVAMNPVQLLNEARDMLRSHEQCTDDMRRYYEDPQYRQSKRLFQPLPWAVRPRVEPQPPSPMPSPMITEVPSSSPPIVTAKDEDEQLRYKRSRPYSPDRGQASADQTGSLRHRVRDAGRGIHQQPSRRLVSPSGPTQGTHRPNRRPSGAMPMAACNQSVSRMVRTHLRRAGCGFGVWDRGQGTRRHRHGVAVGDGPLVFVLESRETGPSHGPVSEPNSPNWSRCGSILPACTTSTRRIGTTWPPCFATHPSGRPRGGRWPPINCSV